MKNYLFIISCLLLFSCKDTPQPVPEKAPAIRTGLYKSKKPSRLEWVNLRMQGVKGCYAGTELTLKPDSTYYMQTCGAVSNGHWYTDSSRLYLKEEYVNWRFDTFKKYGFEGKWPELKKEPLVYVIKDDMIYQVWKKTSIEMLEYSKTKPAARSK